MAISDVAGSPSVKRCDADMRSCFAPSAGERKGVPFGHVGSASEKVVSRSWKGDIAGWLGCGGGRGAAEVFLHWVAIALVGTTVAKLLSIASGQGILRAADPLTGVQLRWLMLWESVVECAVAGLVLSGARVALRLLVVFWLGSVFLSYHGVMALLDPGGYCPCLGTLYGRLGINPAVGDAVAKALAAFFFLGPPLIWGLQRLDRKNQPAASASRAEVDAPCD